MISTENFMEFEYQDLIDNPKKIIASIYKDLIHEDFDAIDRIISKTITNKHSLKSYKYDKSYIDRINYSLGGLIKKQGYQLLFFADSRN